MSHTVTAEDRSAIQFHDVLVREAVFREGVPGAEREPLDAEALGKAMTALSVSVEIGYSFHSPTRCSVFVKASLSPPTDIPLFTELSVAVEGSFSVESEHSRSLLVDFASEQAPLLIWPYARQAITNLTSATILKGVVIPPINMQRVLAAIRESTKPATA